MPKKKANEALTLGDYRGYYDLLKEYNDLKGKTVEIKRTRSKQGVEPTYLSCVGEVSYLTDRLIVINRKDNLGKHSNYPQIVTFTISDLLTDMYHMSVLG